MTCFKLLKSSDSPTTIFIIIMSSGHQKVVRVVYRSLLPYSNVRADAVVWFADVSDDVQTFLKHSTT